MCMGVTRDMIIYCVYRSVPVRATSLAYCPMRCCGATPSVRVLAQAMMITTKRTRTRRNKNDTTNTRVDINDDFSLLSRFTMLLRYSYLCSVIGVAFLNCVPVPVDNTAKRVRCASIFSEWLGMIIIIHNRFGFILNEAVKSMMTSYKGVSRMATQHDHQPGQHELWRPIKDEQNLP
ncbi:hypothetical protein F4802DRAFT_140630 [Xylaria palmicola]|nr:hypothetical protein F4802DRAFT_140630 [Xylaria palmicola]